MAYLVWIYILILFMQVHNENVEALQCEHAKPVKFSNVLKRTGDSYFTRAHIMSSYYYNLPAEFVYGTELVVTKWIWIRYEKIIGAISFTYDSDLDILYFHATKYAVEPNLTIFESRETYLRAIITKKDCQSLSKFNPEIETSQKPSVKFAIVYSNENDSVRLYKTCDGEGEWMQVNQFQNTLLHNNDDFKQMKDQQYQINIEHMELIPKKYFPEIFSVIYIKLFDLMKEQPTVKAFMAT